jgi:arylformamidase
MSRKIIDLTYTIESRMTIFPGVRKPVIEYLSTMEQDGHYTSMYTLVTHAGTHIDAPMHWEKGGQSVDQLPLNKFIGEAVLINLENENVGSTIEVSHLKKYENDIKKGDIVVVNTGIYKSYGNPEFSYKYPAVSFEAAQWLIKKEITTYGTDAVSVDAPRCPDKKAHHAFLGANIPIIESLANLNKISKRRFYLYCPPLKIKDVEASQCRAVAIEE